MGFCPRLPITAKEIFNFRKEYIANRNLIAWSFYNPKNLSEVVDIIITHDLEKLSFIKINLSNLTVNVLSKKDLIKMKEKSGRPQDLLDVEALKKL